MHTFIGHFTSTVCKALCLIATIDLYTNCIQMLMLIQMLNAKMHGLNKYYWE